MDACSLRGDARDLLFAPRWGFSDRKIALHAPGALLALALTILAFRFWSPLSVWKIALLCASFPLIAAPGSIAASRLTFLQLNGDFFADPGAVRWSDLKAAYGPLLALSLLPAALFGLSLLGGALGNLLGDWWTGLGALLLLPGLPVGLLLLFALFIAALGLPLLPAMVGVSGETGSETSYQLVVIAWSQGWRAALYELTALSVSLLAGAGLAAASFGGLFALGCGAALVSESFARSAAASAALVTALFSFGGALPALDMPLPLQIGAWAGAAALLAGLWLAAAYAFSGVSVGNAVIYIHMRRRIWGDDVFERSASGSSVESAAESAEAVEEG